MPTRWPTHVRAPIATRPFAAIVILLAAICLGLPARARAQQAPKKIGPFVVDVRGAVPKFGQNSGLAGEHGLNATDLPSMGLGLAIGGHWYFFKWHTITFGAGGEVLLSRGHQGASTTGPDVTTKFNSFAPQISFNF